MSIIALGALTALLLSRAPSHFGSVVERYLRVEPSIQGLTDDLLRSTALLPLARLADDLSRDANRELGLASRTFDQLEERARRPELLGDPA